MKNTIYLFVFLTLVQVGTSLNCYSCDACDNNNMRNWSRVPGCGNTIHEPGTKGVCLKEVLGNSTMKITSRKCITASIVNGKPNHTCQPTKQMKVIACALCQTDFCNSASSLDSVFVIASGFVTYLINHILT